MPAHLAKRISKIQPSVFRFSWLPRFFVSSSYKRAFLTRISLLTASSDRLSWISSTSFSALFRTPRFSFIEVPCCMADVLILIGCKIGGGSTAPRTNLRRLGSHPRNRTSLRFFGVKFFFFLEKQCLKLENLLERSC